MNSLTFASSTGARIELTPSPRRGADLPVWVATLTGPGLRITVPCPEATWEPTLVEYLESLDADWRGWAGDRLWASEEAEVRLSSRHDKTGAVVMTAVLEDIDVRWRHETVLLLDPGGFGHLVRTARALSIDTDAS